MDSSALIKLVLEERESADLESWISDRAQEPVTSSALAKVEVIRTVRRIDGHVLRVARELLDPLDLIPLSSTVVELAADLSAPFLRSLDALHLASALSIASDLTAFVAYDRRLAAAAAAARLTTVQPGA